MFIGSVARFREADRCLVINDYLKNSARMTYRINLSVRVAQSRLTKWCKRTIRAQCWLLNENSELLEHIQLVSAVCSQDSVTELEMNLYRSIIAAYNCIWVDRILSEVFALWKAVDLFSTTTSVE